MSPGLRVLCIDSSSPRLKLIAETLKKADFEVWTANGASDALCLTTGLHFDALAVDEASTHVRADLWKCLVEAQPDLPMLVHSGLQRVPELCREASQSNRFSPISEVILALLVLLLGDTPLSHASVA
jgi:DNA-binding NtrC family response regulator